jgi:hypothetical protein
MRISIGTELGIFGFGLVLVVSLLDWQNVKMDTRYVIALYALGGTLMVSSFGRAVWKAISRLITGKSKSPVATALRVTPTPVPPPPAPRLSGRLSMRHIPANEARLERVMWKTEEGRDFHHLAGGHPRALRFVKPHEVTVREGNLPFDIPAGDSGRIVVKKFLSDGFTVDEIGSSDVEVEAEVYLKHEDDRRETGTSPHTPIVEDPALRLLHPYQSYEFGTAGQDGFFPFPKGNQRGMRLYLTFMPSGVPDQMLVERVELSVSGKLYPSVRWTPISWTEQGTNQARVPLLLRRIPMLCLVTTHFRLAVVVI